jgi:CheY-like chemotaxis protein
MMPGIDGFEFMERFRRLPKFSRTPVIIWTAKDLTPKDRARLQASVQAIVIKERSGATQLFEELDQYVIRPPRSTEALHGR